MDNTTSILLAEDETSLGLIVKETLESRNFEVHHAKDGEEALAFFKSNQPDVLVLDVMMPKKDGFTLAKEIRKIDNQIPILFLTAKSQTKDVIEGFEHGGNDYIKKPFSIEELIVRIKNLVNRIHVKPDLENLKLGQYQFIYSKQSLIHKNLEQPLTYRESELLLHLVLRKNNVLDRSYILNKIWGNDDFFNARSMDVFITKLRKKLKYDSSISIVNVRGYGYKLICD